MLFTNMKQKKIAFWISLASFFVIDAVCYGVFRFVYVDRTGCIIALVINGIVLGVAVAWGLIWLFITPGDDDYGGLS